jgi:hypothetical protein
MSRHLLIACLALSLLGLTPLSGSAAKKNSNRYSIDGPENVGLAACQRAPKLGHFEAPSN